MNVYIISNHYVLWEGFSLRSLFLFLRLQSCFCCWFWFLWVCVCVCYFVRNLIHYFKLHNWSPGGSGFKSCILSVIPNSFPLFFLACSLAFFHPSVVLVDIPPWAMYYTKHQGYGSEQNVSALLKLPPLWERKKYTCYLLVASWQIIQKRKIKLKGGGELAFQLEYWGTSSPFVIWVETWMRWGSEPSKFMRADWLRQQ